MALSADDYLIELQELFPPGPAWSKDPNDVLNKILAGLAVEFARADQRLDDLVNEADPRTTSDLLSDWERVAGLPDNCQGELANTAQGRRAALVSKLRAQGGQTPGYYIDVAASLGYTVTITEHVETDESGIYSTWTVQTSVAANIVNFRAGRSRAGERLRSWGSSDLECKLNQLKPAHTRIQFSYT